jgi:acetylornithine aminotransferase
MNLFDVYPLWNIEPVKGLGCKIWDKEGKEYLDLYGGHAVISIGHSHPTYVKMVQEQVSNLGFYSNAVQNQLQKDLAKELGEVCGYPDYDLFLCNSGAEANENALKVASFHTGRKRILALGKAFHGRTSGAVEATDNPKIQAEFNRNGNITFIPMNDLAAAKQELEKREYAAIIIEGIQGVAGIYAPDTDFLKGIRELCNETGTLLILDEIQFFCVLIPFILVDSVIAVIGYFIDDEFLVLIKELVEDPKIERPLVFLNIEHSVAIFFLIGSDIFLNLFFEVRHGYPPYSPRAKANTSRTLDLLRKYVDSAKVFFIHSSMASSDAQHFTAT